MDRISDSGSEDMGSTPFEDTEAGVMRCISMFYARFSFKQLLTSEVHN